MKYKAMWYNMDHVVLLEEDLIEADSYEEATRKAHSKYNGKPPAPMLSLSEVK